MGRRASWMTLLALCACLSRVPPKKHDQFDRIGWVANYAAALEQAGAQNKPLLVVMVAGARNGEC